MKKCASEQRLRECALEPAKYAHGVEVFMKIKKLFGLCERKGCKKFACRVMTIYDKKKGKIGEIHLCDDCAWDIYENGIEELGERK